MIPALVLQVDPDGVSHASVRGLVEVDLPEVLAIVTDCASYEQWFPDIRQTRVLSRGLGELRCAGQTDLPWPVPDRSWEIDVQSVSGSQTALASFQYVPGSGNLQALSGSYTLVRVEAGLTEVTYEVTVDPGFWVPSFLVAWAHQGLLGVFEAIEQQARAKG
jgi:hypothetical protein